MDYESLDVADYMVDGMHLYFVRRNAEQFVAAILRRPVCVMQELKQLCELATSGASCIVVIEGATAEDEQLLADAQYFTSGHRAIVWLFAPSRQAAKRTLAPPTRWPCSKEPGHSSTAALDPCPLSTTHGRS